ncbi:hypothetical protein VNO77_29326 [Canavalia gladiata]|uniref:Transcription repressor n=1 Tax=Canavalia gladiata TaxID=3824 RepID=A0AAN9KX00_CANGL
MPKKIQDYFFKIRKPFNSSRNFLLSGCKHPRTPSFAVYAATTTTTTTTTTNNNNNNIKDDAATLADVDRFLLENFKSLYLKDDDEEKEEGPKLGSLLLEDGIRNRNEEEAGSTSTVNDASSSSINSYDAITKEDVDPTLPDNTIALLTYSPNPYQDFKRSMQQMVEAKAMDNVIDWDFMEELFFCYLNLNHKKSHKFILAAFVDLLTAMRPNSEPSPSKPRSVRTVRTPPQLRNNTPQVTLQFASS